MDHTTIYRWIQRDAPELDRLCRPHLKARNDSWRVDETSIIVKKQEVYLYRAVDSQGNTLDFCFSSTRGVQAAKQFFLKTLAASHNIKSRIMNVDKNAAYPKAFNELKAEGYIPESCELRQVNYLNNSVQQDHRFIKRLMKPAMSFFSCEMARRTLQGFEVNEYDVERAMTRDRKRRCERSSRLGRQAVWSGCLREIEEAAHAQFLFFIVFATQPHG